MDTYQALVESLVDQGALKTPRIINAFTAVNRADFMPSNSKQFAGEDRPFRIGYGQTISQPYTLAKMIEWLQPQAGDNVLDVGAGSGWTSAILGKIVGVEGSVVGTETIKDLVEFARSNLEPYRYEHVQLQHTPINIGYPKQAPYDRILVSAAGEEIPQELVEQLKPEGKMVIPVKSEIIVYQNGETPHQTSYGGFAFVPLK